MTPNTPTSDDLMERLRKSAEADAFFDDANGAEMHLAAADHIEALRARCEALEGATQTILARCEAMEDESVDELAKEQSQHAAGYWRGQKSTAKCIRRELHDLTRAALSHRTTSTETK